MGLITRNIAKLPRAACSHFRIFVQEEGKRGIAMYQTWHIVHSITLYHFTSHIFYPLFSFRFQCYHDHRLRIHRCATRHTSPMISLSHGLRHFHTHFWQVHLFEFQYKCITEKCILPFYKRPGQKHNFICCLKCAGQLPFINICEPRQSCGKFS